MSEMAWESFAQQFGGEIIFDFAQPNTPSMIAAEIDGFSRAINDMTAPLVASRDKVIDNIREHFEQEKDPYGHSWAPWAESYAARGEAENIGILRKSEDLFHAATDMTAYPIIGDDLWVTTNGFPDYWATHNYGYNRIPQREFLGPDEKTQLEIVDIFDGWLEGNLRLTINPLTGGSQVRAGSGQFAPLSSFKQTTFKERFSK